MTTGRQPPVVSALMIVRDREGLLPEAVASVLAQEGPSFELLIVDDGSTDGTVEVAAHFAATDSRIRVLPSRRCGIPTSRNRGLAAACGEFIAICDSDDLSRPGRFHAQVAALRANPRLVGVGSRFSVFRDDPTDGEVVHWRWGLRRGRGPFAFPTGMLRTASVRAVEGFDESFAIVEDLDLCYRLAARGGEFALLPEVLVDYRVSGQGVTTGNPELYWYAAKAQWRGLRALKGGFSPAGYAAVGQSLWRAARDRYRRRFSSATAR